MKDVYPFVEKNGEVIKFNGKPLVDAKSITLCEWLESLTNDTIYVPYWEFPTDAHRNEYISAIHKYSETDFRDLIRRFLIETGSVPINLYGLDFRLKHRPDLKLEFDRRLINAKEPWEGITWVLDLLPSRPEAALEVIRSYFYVHCQLLPDGRWRGLSDAMSLIRARYLSIPETPDEIREMLLKLSFRHFEVLIAKLYKQMGYLVELTPPTKDDGIDIFCNRDDPGRRELLIIQCKCHRKNLGLKYVKELLGSVTDKKATKGVLITPGEFTKYAVKKANNNPQLELLGGKSLQYLLAQHLGVHWTVNLDRLITEDTLVKKSDDQ